MKTKKTKVITLRTTEDIYDKLNSIAERKGWTVSQVANKACTEYAEANYVEANKADMILKRITETNCTDFTELSVWAIQNDCTDELTKGIAVWRALLDENADKAKA